MENGKEIPTHAPNLVVSEQNSIAPSSPAGIMMQMASSGGEFDVDKMAKLLEIQERYEANEAKKAYHQAMSLFQANTPKIIKQKSGHNCKYAGLSDIVSVIAPLLSEQGLSHSWVTATSEKEVIVTCKITHVLGHSETTVLSAGSDTSGSKNDVQALGSTITYLQRYTLKAALGLAESDQDDDGAGSEPDKPIEYPDPTDDEQAVIDEVTELLIDIAAEQGRVPTAELVARVCYKTYSKYPDPSIDIPKMAKWMAGKYLIAATKKIKEN